MLRFLKSMASVLISRKGLFFLNLLLLAMTSFMCFDIVLMLIEGIGELSSIDALTDDVATVMVAFGVLIEERKEIAHMIGQSESKSQSDEIPATTNYFGIYFVVIGLFIEVYIESCKIISRYVDGGLMETVMVHFSLLIAISGLIPCLLFSYELIKPAKLQLQVEHHE
jgi:hypothetical protein